MATYLGRFLILAKLASEWSAANPVLMNGELGVSDPGSATPILKVGDGARPWSALPPISGAGGGGASPDYVVGTTDTLPAGSFATVTIDNAASPPTISFGIPRGAAGPPNTLAIGTTTTGLPGSPASATITGDAPNQTLNLVIPQGPIGPQGADGADGSTGPAGATGPANVLTIGVVTTGAAGSAADASITGTAPAQVLNLTLPTGATGPQGPVGPVGPSGPAGSTTLADPTGVIGLVAVPGVSAFGIRSDAAPALSQAIAPTWTAQHIFSLNASVAVPNIALANNNPVLRLTETDQAADAKHWSLQASGGAFIVRATNDAFTAASNALVMFRAGAALTTLEFGNATDNATYSFLGTGLTTFTGSIAGVAAVWTGAHTWSAATPQHRFIETDAPLDEKIWNFAASAGHLVWEAYNDAISGFRTFLDVDRVGITIGSMTLGNASDNPAYNFLGTGLTTMGGPLQVNGDHVAIANTDVYFEMRDTDAAADTKVWWLRHTGGNFSLQTRADSLAAGENAFTATRTGTAITQLVFGNATNNPTYSFTGTGAVSAASFTTTSARAVKRVTGAPRRAADLLARLRPLLYRLLDGDEHEQLGLIAEEVNEVCPQLSDGKTVAYDRLAILLLAAWQDEHAEAA